MISLPIKNRILVVLLIQQLVTTILAMTSPTLTELTELLTDGVIISVVETDKIISVNSSMEKITGYSKERLLEMSWTDFLSKFQLLEQVQDVIDHLDQTYHKQCLLISRYDQKKEIEVVVSSIISEDEPLLVTVITPQVNRENAHLRDVLNSFIECYQLFNNVSDLQELANSVCEILVDEAHEAMVWLGLLDFDNLDHILPIASAGSIPDLFDGIDSLELSNSNIATVIEYGESVVIEDIDKEEHQSIWTIIAEELNLQSILLIPLQSDELTFGILSLFSKKRRIYTTEITLLYQELAIQLSKVIISYLFEEETKIPVTSELFHELIHDVNNVFTKLMSYTHQAKQSGDSNFLDSINQELMQFANHLESMEEGSYQPYQDNISVDSQIPGDDFVLVVDDDFGSRQYLMEILQAQDFEVVLAENGEQAINIIEEYHDQIILVITDIMMTNISGLELAEMIRDTYPTMKLVFISGYQITPFVEEKLETPTSRFLSKPFQPQTLLNLIKEVLD